MFRRSLLYVTLAWATSVAGQSAEWSPWQNGALREICAKYLGETPAAEIPASDRVIWVDRLSKSIGDRLAQGGLAGVPSEDVALLAVLQARLGSGGGQPPAPAQVEPEPERLPGPGAAPPPEDAAPQVGEKGVADVGKGLEGLQQGIEKLEEMPLSQRMAMSGDVNAGVQAMRVPGATDMSTAFGRFRLNVVTRAVPAAPDGSRGTGYFFIQLRAAGGAFDSTSVGHPPAFSPFNDVATDRSQFNEGLSSGNLYLGKAYYQQQFRFGVQRDYSLLAQFGVIDFSDFFDMNEFANNEVRQFLNGAFVNSAAFKTAVGAPGAVGEFRKDIDWGWAHGLAVRGGYAVARVDRVFSSPIWSGEVELSTLLNSREGTWRAGGSAGNVAEAGGFGSFYMSADHWVSNNFGVFGRLVANAGGEGSQFFGQQKASLSGGIQRRFVDADDHISAWGLAFSRAWGIETSDPLSAETVLETYYRWQITDSFSLTPDLQIIHGAGGVPGTHLVLGLRTNVDF